MATKRLEKIEFEFDGQDYALDFGINQVKDLARFSMNREGKVNNTSLVKFALLKNNKTSFITEKRAKDITEALTGGIQWDGDFLEFDEVIEYILGLFAQAIDDESKLHEPATIVINDDNTVDLTVNGEVHLLKYNRKDIEEALKGNLLGSGSVLELYMVGSSLIRTGLLHSKRRISVGLQDELLMSAWATMNNDDTKNDFPDMLQALVAHMDDVLDDGVKKSKAVIKTKK